MSEYEITLNLPLPPVKQFGQPRKYPWPLMNVGDSFACEKIVQGPKEIGGATRKWVVRRNPLIVEDTAQYGRKMPYRIWRHI